MQLRSYSYGINQLVQNYKSFSGIYGVGKAALCPPALAVLSHKPENATKNIAWVGKGIVYDTGGLSIKDKVQMYNQFYYVIKHRGQH